MIPDTSETITHFLEQILGEVHPLMAEGLYLAAVPGWYNTPLLAAMRQRDDGRDEGIVERLARYSFIIPLDDNLAEPAYMVRPEERAFLQAQWIRQDPQAYRAAHRRALAYWEANPDSNPFAQAQNRLYHWLFVDEAAAINYLVDRFRAYRNDRQLAAIDRLLDTAVEARVYLALLGDIPLQRLDDLLTYLRARLAQLRGDWTMSLGTLQALQQKSDLSPRLAPYVCRATGEALAQDGHYVEAIRQYESALAQFTRQASDPATAAPEVATLQAERGQTLITLGDAHVGLAVSARGYQEKVTATFGRFQPLIDLFSFFLALPLVVFLSFYLGRRVWHPRFWPALRQLDWMIARLFATGARHYLTADPLLEQYGTPAEGVAADEKLAYLYLAMGDARQAETLFLRLLAETSAPLGDYRRASVQVGLAEARLRLNRPAEAGSELAAAVPVLQLYEDVVLLADAQALLGEASLALGTTAEALTAYGRALQLYWNQGDLVSATEVGERLEQLANDNGLDGDQHAMVQQLLASLTERRYPVRFRHPATILLQRGTLLLLAFIIFLIPISTIRLETGSAVAPVITFSASPLLDPSTRDFSPVLSQGVAAVNLQPSPNPNVLVWLGVLLFIAYLVLSTGIGLLVIARTPLSQVQAAGQAATISLTAEQLRMGMGDEQRAIPWDAITHFYRADVYFVNNLMIDNSLSAVVAPAQRLLIRGATALYPALRRHMAQRLPPTARRVDLSYSLLRSKMGWLYLGTILLFALLSLLGTVAPRLVTADFPGTPYSLADLYPYFYLGLFVPPLWTFVIRPLQIRRHLTPGHRLPWLVGAVGMGLAALRLATLFRPWFTVPDIYPSLAILILVGGAGLTIWTARRVEAGQPVYPIWVRGLTLVVTAAVFLVIGSQLWREATAYHYLVIGNTHRDRALYATDETAKVQQATQAIAAYDRAISIASRPFLGIDRQAALKLPFGIPRPHQTVWLAALNSRAALAAQLGNYPAAIRDYTELIEYTDRRSQAYASRAIAYLSWGTMPGEELGEVEVVAQRFAQALQDFDQAIELEPENASYRLWRGVAHHALDNETAALTDYDVALAITGRDALSAEERAQALTGEAWVYYGRGEYERARELFEDAADVDRESADAKLGLGYVYYSTQAYDQALTSWQETATLDATNPLVLISLGTLHWRLGTLGDDYGVRGTNRCLSDVPDTEKQAEAALFTQAIDYFDQAADLQLQSDDRNADKDAAFTYRTRGQVQFLLADCPGYDKVGMYQAAIESYDQAIEHDSANALYWHYRGRIAYRVWDSLPAGTGPTAREWLFRGLRDQEQALTLNPTDNPTADYTPHRWQSILYTEAITGTLRRGDQRFAAGDYDLARQYYELVAENRPDHAGAAFKAGLAALAQGDETAAVAWYEAGLARAQATGDTAAVNRAAAELATLAAAGETEVDAVVALFQSQGIIAAQPTDAATAFDLALLALVNGDGDEAADLYNQGLELAATARTMGAVVTAAANLGAYLLENPSIDVLDVYWPLYDDPTVRQAAVGRLTNPDLYWRYRAEFGFRLLNLLFRQQPGNERADEVIFASVIYDIEQAYRLNRSQHQVWRDFFVDANIGYLYLRRGDDAYQAQAYEQALADYAEATRRIRPVSANAAGDLTDATFKAGLTALQLERVDDARNWYAQGIALVERYDTMDALNRAIAALQALTTQSSYRNLAPVIAAILEDLDEASD